MKQPLTSTADSMILSNVINTYCTISLNTSVSGNMSLSNEDNESIFKLYTLTLKSQNI